MDFLGLFWPFFSSCFWHGATSGIPAEPLHRTISRWIVGIAVLATVGWVGWKLAKHPRGVSSFSSPTIEESRQLSELVTAKVTVADARETSLNGYLGGVKAILLVRGDALLGPDLSQAKIESSDPATKVIVIELPRPHLISYRIDHSATKLVSLSHDGLWVIVPGDAGRMAVLNRAYYEAERAVATTAVTRETVNDAAEHAQSVLAAFFSSGGWKIEIRWKEGE